MMYSSRTPHRERRRTRLATPTDRYSKSKSERRTDHHHQVTMRCVTPRRKAFYFVGRRTKALRHEVSSLCHEESTVHANGEESEGPKLIRYPKIAFVRKIYPHEIAQPTALLFLPTALLTAARAVTLRKRAKLGIRQRN